MGYVATPVFRSLLLSGQKVYVALDVGFAPTQVYMKMCRKETRRYNRTLSQTYHERAFLFVDSVTVAML